MSDTLSLAALADGTILSPFSRLRQLLDGVAPGHAKPIDLTLGEPRETMPPFVAAKIAEAEALFAKYPPIRGSDELRAAIAAWIGRRFNLEGIVDPATEILPCNGSREGLFYAAFPAVGRKQKQGLAERPAILMCNPFYQAYLGGALAAGAEPVFLDATAATGHLPDLDALEADPALLARTAALYLCSPANPQGAVASEAYIARALALARTHDFMLFFDECYSEIYSGAPPPGGLEVAAKTPERFRNLVVFNSLSKRSNLPGLRSGFSAGDGGFLATLFEVRNLIGPQMPGPTQHASAAVWAEEQHVTANRLAYSRKYDVADAVLGDRFGYRRPAGGFFLWLDMSQIGDGAHAALTLWKRFGVKVIPGAYLAQTGPDGTNPGANYIRVALVHDEGTIREALERLVHVSA
ncbi:aminotransferase class I/II-fold pyridoxal phosphate-dependent enzyme [Hyphomicrobium sp. LHD-15]|uniref:aminotransferase class I/II-fold pyridoxal phosphate-dependent enzyme n=1 Tax=Hyphomicrobium sp. LHD-15 TaxID=3072142 RepID=UPI00280FBF55|nr:aminotransferase class I/II-fold pyridoxal phosphate-dependent enzyme [Hyphomicrobium sp. LHD-15]MDQ8700263.1 aminotransferase class I/II-fold pyridoxal phosphate-dependent enzyme [Hyphomicrobium sp. LHD-15]